MAPSRSLSLPGRAPCCRSPVSRRWYSFCSRCVSVRFTVSMDCRSREMLRPAPSSVCFLMFTLRACETAQCWYSCMYTNPTSSTCITLQNNVHRMSPSKSRLNTMQASHDAAKQVRISNQHIGQAKISWLLQSALHLILKYGPSSDSNTGISVFPIRRPAYLNANIVNVVSLIEDNDTFLVQFSGDHIGDLQTQKEVFKKRRLGAL